MITNETKITKKINHDSMWLSAQFPSGAYLKFSVNRNGDTLDLRFSNDLNILKEQMRIIISWLAFTKNETTHQQRFNRLENVCKSVKSGDEFMNFIKK